MNEDAYLQKLYSLKEDCLNGESIDSLKNKLRSYAFIETGGYSYTGAPISQMTMYRARVFKNKAIPPNSMYEFIHPMPHNVNKTQRANRPNTTLFYASLFEETCVNEANPEVGDYVSLLRLKKKSEENLLLCPIGFDEEILSKKCPGRQDCNLTKYLKEVKKSKSEPNKLNLITNRFFSDIFTESINPEKLYNLTTAIAELHLEASQLHGIIFPSIAHGLYCNNVALKDSAIKLFTYDVENSPLSYSQITGKTSDKFDGEKIAYASMIDTKTGFINWQYIS